MPSLLDQVVVVLYEPQDPINIGATVRVMKNMGVPSLRLVRPRPYDANKIEQVAHNTRDVVAGIRHFDALDDALADCVRVAAFSGRPRAHKWDRSTPRLMADDLLGHATLGTVAVLFGREDHGLPADAVDRAHVVVSIPTTEHMSLNLAQAVLVALYELHLRAADATVPPQRFKDRNPPPPKAELERYFADAERALDALDFFKTRNPEHVMRTLRSLVLRAQPDTRELALWRAMSIEVLRTIDRIEKRLGARPADAPQIQAASRVPVDDGGAEDAAPGDAAPGNAAPRPRGAP
jgi:tRNA/rRNA methyltransferase/tRNA (cytidine32/uridine32-2'-O)-methyltransferase